MRKRRAQRTNQNIMKGVIAMALIVLLVCYLFLTMVSCTDGAPTFKVDGTITEAQDSTLVLEAMTLTGVQPLDSVRLKADGSFSFLVKGVPQDSTASPEFYRLRIARQVINFVVDSLEDIQVQATYPQMATGYDIQGNEASRTMKTLTLLNLQLQQQLKGLEDDSSMSAIEKVDRVKELVNNYKLTLKRDYILKDPSSSAAYFALFQTLWGQMLFDPETDKNDVQYFAAIATQWEQYYPYSPRTANLKNIALRGLRNTRQTRPIELQIDGEKIRESGIIDFGFPDIQGNERRLSDLKDYVVLLDFTAYALPQSQQRTLELREIYNKYHSRGLEIYQVSLDADEHYWKTKCEQLPWVCVYCAEGISNDMVHLYNVQSLPTYFLIGRGSDMRARQEQIEHLEKAIEAEL